MNSRNSYNCSFDHKDLIHLTLELLPKLDLIDLQNLIMQAELEIDYRRHKQDASE